MLQAPKRRPRCALTGVPVAAGDVVMTLDSPTHRQRPRYLEPGNGDPLSAPQTLHRNVQDGAVGLAYAVMMARYLEIGLAEQRTSLSAAERIALIAWWDIDADGGYGVRRVRRKLLAELCEKLDEADAVARADHIITVAVRCHLEQADPDEIGPRYGHDGQWVRRIIDWTFRLANRRGHKENGTWQSEQSSM